MTIVSSSFPSSPLRLFASPLPLVPASSKLAARHSQSTKSPLGSLLDPTLSFYVAPRTPVRPSSTLASVHILIRSHTLRAKDANSSALVAADGRVVSRSRCAIEGFSVFRILCRVMVKGVLNQGVHSDSSLLEACQTVAFVCSNVREHLVCFEPSDKIKSSFHQVAFFMCDVIYQRLNCDLSMTCLAPARANNHTLQE